MSLSKQLWLAIIFLTILIFSGIFIVSSLSAKNYLEQQLFMKNSDNAAALALSLTQQKADPVLLELTLSAQFDTGHYELIQLLDPNGHIIIERRDEQTAEGAPHWFTQLFPIVVQPGVAQVQQGWQQLGTLTVRSHARFAYRELWSNTQRQAAVFLIAMIFAGILGSYILKLILRPLEDVVTQAEAIGEQRFITIDEPYTREFKAVVSSMNNLSQRIKVMLQQEAKRLEKWRREVHVDKVTGLDVREPFMSLLASTLDRDDADTSGVLSIIRISELLKLNQTQGRAVIDAMLAGFGKTLSLFTLTDSGWAAGRMNGSDFAILSPHAMDPAKVGGEIQQALLEVLKINGLEAEVKLPGASIEYRQGDTVSGLMGNLDAALIASESTGESIIGTAVRDNLQIVPAKQNLMTWEAIFEAGFEQRQFSLASYPVTDLRGELIHKEAPARLQWDGRDMSAGEFLPWINRLELAEDFDRHVVTLAIQEIEAANEPLCINLSYAAVANPAFLLWLIDKLSAHAEAASQLSLEVSEAMAFLHLDSFKKMCARVKTYGCKMGIEHMGHKLPDIGLLHDAGLDYLKVDAAFIRGIDSNVANQTLLRMLCSLGHSMGASIIAEGVQSEPEWNALEDLGVDGATGPEVTRRDKES